MNARALFRILPLLLLTLLLGSCAAPSGKAPTVASVTLTDAVHEKTKAPLTSLTAFPAQSSQLYASVKVLNPRKGTTLMARWYYAGMLVDEADVTFDVTGSRNVAFHLTAKNAEQSFPNGRYKVEILLDGKLAQAVDFRVE